MAASQKAENGASDPELEALRTRLSAFGQEHVLRFWGELSAAERASLRASLARVDLEEVAAARGALQAEAPKGEIGVFKEVTDLAAASAEERGAWRRAGLLAIARGQVCAVLLAGGQGTRLGSNKPKGLYDVGLPSHKSLLQIQAERIVKLKQLAAREAGCAVDRVSLPWYIMTSDFTGEETEAFFRSHGFFGLPPGDLAFFQQSDMPCLTADGKLMLESRSALAMAPSGNGAVYAALAASGSLQDMRRRGVEYAHVFGVDNILVKVADPAFVGYCVARGAEVGNKVVRKAEPHERVGVMCLRGGCASVVEYSEISREMAEARDAASGQLLFGAANIVNHLFTRAFLERCAAAPLPFHVAHKAIACVSDDGKSTVTPPRPNGYKLERFVFDSFARAERVAALAVARDAEFSPVKNMHGPDSPETARRDVSALHRRLVEQAGGRVEGEGAVEVSPLLSYEGEDLAPRVAGKTFAAPVHIA